MRQQEKTQRTRERILSAALVEFGAKGYEGVSINAICSETQIPKGLLYHNFKNKDDLYLQCVRRCYDQMVEYLSAQEPLRHDAEEDMKALLMLRQRFFLENPHHANLFFRALLQPPNHLLAELHEARRPFDAFCTERYRSILTAIPLRDGITEQKALEYFSVFLEMFNGYFQSKAAQGDNYRALMEDHEEKLFEILDILLYGIARQNEKGGKVS